MMTGRDLIVYILSNHLEDEPIVEDGKFVGLITAMEAAEKMGVGPATIFAWLQQEKLDGVIIGDNIYVPANFKLLTEEDHE